MKKFLAFALVVVMCLSITACASKKEKLYDKYEKLIEALEDEDFEGAMKEVIELYEKAEDETDDNIWGNGGIGNGDGDDGEDEVDPEVEAMKAALPGEWIPTIYYAEEEGCTAFVLNEDGTTTINGEDYTWEISNMSSSYGSINVNSGDTKVYSLEISKYEDGSYGINIYEPVDEYSSTHIGRFYRAADYTKLEITKDNWDDYFEIIERSYVNKNDFGELTSITVDFDIVLKEKYGKVNGELSKTVIEYSYKDILVKYSADLEDGSYKKVGVVEGYEDSEPYTSTANLYNISYEGDVYRYGFDWEWFTIDVFPEDEAWINKDFQIIRMISEVYVYNTAE